MGWNNDVREGVAPPFFSCLLFWMAEKQMLLAKYIHNNLNLENSLGELWDVYAGRTLTRLQHVCVRYCSVPVASSGSWSSSFRIRVHLDWLECCSMLHKADASVPPPAPPIRMRTIRKSRGKVLVLFFFNSKMATVADYRKQKSLFPPLGFHQSFACAFSWELFHCLLHVQRYRFRTEIPWRNLKMWTFKSHWGPQFKCGPTVYTLIYLPNGHIIPISIHPSTFNPNVPIIWKHILNQLTRCYPASSSCGGSSQRHSGDTKTLAELKPRW